MSRAFKDRHARTLYVTSWGKHRNNLKEGLVKEVFAPFPILEQVYIKFMPEINESAAFLTFDSVAAAENAFQMASDSAKNTHGLNLRIRWRTTKSKDTTPPTLSEWTADGTGQPIGNLWRCPDPLCGKMNSKDLTNCQQCHCPRKIKQDDRIITKATKDPEISNGKETMLSQMISKLATSATAESHADKPQKQKQHQSLNQQPNLSRVVSKGRGRGNRKRGNLGVAPDTDGSRPPGVVRPATVNGSNTTDASSTGTKGSNKDQYADGVMDLLSNDEKFKLLDANNESLAKRLEEAQAQIAHLKAAEFETQLRSLSELWQDLDHVKSERYGNARAPAIPVQAPKPDREGMIQILVDLESVLAKEGDIFHSREVELGRAHNHFRSCSAMAQGEEDPVIKDKLKRQWKEAEDILKTKLQKHLLFYRDVSLDDLEANIRSFMDTFGWEAATAAVAGSHVTAGDIRGTINLISNLPNQEDACDVDVTAEDAVNDLADKLVQVSEMLKAKRKVPASLGLNHSAGAALKIVDRAYQNQTVPAHPASNQLFQVVAPCLRGAYTRVVALMEDRNETTDMLTRLGVIEQPGCSPGNDSLEVAEILGRLDC